VIITENGLLRNTARTPVTYTCFCLNLGTVEWSINC